MLTEEAAGQRRGVLPDTRRCTACLQELSKSHFSHTQLQKGLSRLKCKACTSAAHTQGIERARADSAGTGWPGAYRGIDDIYRSVVPDGYSDRSLPVRACAPVRRSILAHAHVSAHGAVRRSHRTRVSHEPLGAAQAAQPHAPSTLQRVRQAHARAEAAASSAADEQRKAQLEAAQREEAAKLEHERRKEQCAAAQRGADAAAGPAPLASRGAEGALKGYSGSRGVHKGHSKDNPGCSRILQGTRGVFKGVLGVLLGRAAVLTRAVRSASARTSGLRCSPRRAE